MTSGVGNQRGDERPSIWSWPFIAVIRVYQVVLGPFLGGRCRFEPSCSEYGIEAYRVHGPLRGTWLTVWRLLRCQPFGGHGLDPVPPRRGSSGHDPNTSAQPGEET